MADSDEITMSKDALAKLIDERVSEANRMAKMTKEEKQIREIVRDESKRSFLEALGEFFHVEDEGGGEGGGEGSGGENDGGGEGIVTRLGRTFAGMGGDK